jgi:hypothetical protein
VHAAGPPHTHPPLSKCLLLAIDNFPSHDLGKSGENVVKLCWQTPPFSILTCILFKFNTRLREVAHFSVDKAQHTDARLTAPIAVTSFPRPHCTHAGPSGALPLATYACVYVHIYDIVYMYVQCHACILYV